MFGICQILQRSGFKENQSYVLSTVIMTLKSFSPSGLLFQQSCATGWTARAGREGARLHSCQVHPPRLVSVTAQTAQSLWRGNWLGDVTCQIIIFIRLNELEKTHNFQAVTSERKKINKSKTISTGAERNGIALLRWRKSLAPVENQPFLGEVTPPWKTQPLAISEYFFGDS